MHRQPLVHARGSEALLRMDQVMQRLGVSRSTAYRLKDEGQLGDVFNIGAGVRVTASGVDAYLERCRNREADVPSRPEKTKSRQKKHSNPKKLSHASHVSHAS